MPFVFIARLFFNLNYLAEFRRQKSLGNADLDHCQGLLVVPGRSTDMLWDKTNTFSSKEA